jgi:flagellar basal body-associated protein FliL
MERRTVWIIVGVVLVVLVLIIAIPCALLLGKSEAKPKTNRERALAVLEDTPLIDG